MESLHGFAQVSEGLVEERNTKATQYEHIKTGARVLILKNEDENKSFVISFPTPPEDSTGIAHIMEHSVLCGSEKYPVKEPFIELVKGSLQTFLNAFTASVETYYPVASQNKTDLFNLMGVYLDAVFFPRLTPEVLQQEGWHLELSEDGKTLSYKGVVFNEMKGAHASADREIYEHLERHLLPDTPYHHDSGGAPKHIPDLTWEYFEAFHKKYYHPTHSLTVVYGDDESDDALRLLDSYFSRFERAAELPKLPIQHRFNQPRKLSVALPGEKSEEDEVRIAIGWLISDTIGARESLAYNVLSYVLVGTPASPLRQRIIDSGLVKDIGGGAQQEHQTSFILGMKGIDPANVEKVEALVIDVLNDLSKNGIPSGAIEAAINSFEFALRENNSGSFPRGLSLAFEALSGWRYGEDPIERLRFEDDLTAIRESVVTGKFFETMIEDLLLNNAHKVTIVGVTDSGLTAQETQEEEERLADLRLTLTDADRGYIIESNERRKAWQDTPNSKEDLATLPSLTLADLDRKIRTTPTRVEKLAGVDLYAHDLFTNGIVYLDLAFDLTGVPLDTLRYCKLLCRSMLEMGTAKRGYIDLLQEIGKSTGGISIRPTFTVHRTSGETIAKIIVRAKSTLHQIPALIELLQEVLRQPNLTDTVRFKSILNEEETRLTSSLVPSGNRYAEARLKSLFHPADNAEEIVSGLSYIPFVKNLAGRSSDGIADAITGMNSIYNNVIRKSGVILNITCDAESTAKVLPQLEGLINALPDNDISPASWTERALVPYEGVIIPSPVNFVATALNLYDNGYKWSGSVDSITRYVNTVWLWEQVRVKGGAYGGSARFDPSTGICTFSSYRDPNLDDTLDRFKETADFLTDIELDEESLVRLTIGTIGGLDAYQLPDAKGFTAFVRHLIGETDEARQKRRDQVLGLTAADFQEFGQVLKASFEKAYAVILAGKESLENSKFSQLEDYTVTEVI
jgi:Zn-dependent M16 (insulinase) family peptidase